MFCIPQALDHGTNSCIGHLLIVNVLAVDIVLVNVVPCILNKTGLGFRLIALVKRIAKKLVAKPATPEGNNDEGSDDEKLLKHPLKAKLLICRWRLPLRILP